MQIKGEKVDTASLIEVVCAILVSTLLDVQGEAVIGNQHLRETLLETLKEEDDEVVDCDLKVLVKYVNRSQNLEALIKKIVDVVP